MDYERKLIKFGENNYYIYSDGRVFNSETNKFIGNAKKVRLSYKGKRKPIRIKALIFKYFPPDESECKLINFGNNNYYIYKDGRVLISDTGNFMKLQCDKGYFRVGLSYNGHEKRVSVHRLLGLAFIENPENKPTIDHINRNPSDNRLENLRWATVKEQNENQSHPKHHNVKVGKSGEKYIKITKYGTYEVRIPIDQHRISKNFKTLTEGIAYRNKICEELDLPTK